MPENNNYIWAKSLGGSKDDFTSAISTDSAGNVYITGNFDSTDFDPGTGTNLPNQGRSDIFVAKLDTSGNPVWAKNLGGSKDDFTSGISADSAGNVYITGNFDSTDFDPGTGTNLPLIGGTDIFVAKLDTSGNPLWAKNLGGSKDDFTTGISADSAGNVYITGNFDSTDFDPGTGKTLRHQGGSDIFVAKLDTSGNPVWAKNLGGSKDDFTSGISTSAGNVYISGNFDSPDFDPGTGTTLPLIGGTDIFVAKLDTSGNPVWAKNFGGGKDDFARGISADSTGTVYLSGNFDSTDFDPGTGTNLPLIGRTDIFVAKLDISGNPLWAKNLGGSKDDFARGISLDSTGNVYTTGDFDSTDFDPGGGTNLPNQGRSDILVSKWGFSPIGVSIIQSKNSTNVTEDGTIIDNYTIALTSIPNSSVTIILTPSNAEIDLGARPGIATTLNFAPDATALTPQAVNFTVINDPIAEGNHSSIITHSGSSFDPNLVFTVDGIAGNTVTVNITDNDTIGIDINPSDTLTTETGETANFQLVLTSQPTSDVIVNLNSSNPQEGIVSTPNLTFTPSNWSISQLVTVTGVDDNIQDGNQSYSIITNTVISNDPNYSGFDPDDVTLTNIDNDTIGININPTDTLTTETGETANFQMVLTSQPTSDVIVNLNSINPQEGIVSTPDLTFTPSNWSISQLVTVTGVDDNIQDGNQPYSIITNTVISNDPNYSGFDPDDVTLTNIDNDTIGININPLDALITSETIESATFNIGLNSQPTSDVLISLTNNDTTEGTLSTSNITFNSTNWSTPQLVTVTGVDDDIQDGDISYSIIASVAENSNNQYSSLPPETLSFINKDDDTIGININLLDTLTSETLETATFNIALNSQPTSDVLISLTNNDTTEGTLSTNNITFNSTNWSTSQLVTVTGVDDDIQDGDISYSIIASVAKNSNSQYSSLPPETLSFINQDDDTIGININLLDTLTSETLETATFNIALNSQPTSDVLISLTNNDTTEGTLSTSNVTFNSTNWSTSQLVTVTGVDDDIQDGDISYSIIASVAESRDSQYAELADQNIAITNVDDDTANILIDPNILKIVEGGNNNYSIILTTEPIEPITISFNTDEQIKPIPDIVFDKDNWNIAQTVLVEVVDDQELQGDRDTTITHQITSPEPNYNGLTINSVFVKIEDNDSLAEISINPTNLTLTEGEENATYQIGLSAKPNNPVIINFETENQLQPISSLTFDLNNWNQPQTIEVKTVDDAIAESSQTITIRHTVNTTDPQYLQVTLPDVTTTINDNDTASVLINQSQESTDVSEAGITDFYEVILTSQPTANVTLTIKSDSQTDLGNGQDSQITLTFTPDNWNLPQLVNISAIDDSIVEDEIHTSTLVHSISSSDNNYNSKTPIFIDQVETSFLTVNITENDKPLPPGTANIRLIQPVNTTEVWEGFGFDIYKVVLESEPTADVAIAINYGEQVKANQQTITFTPNNWNIPQIITVEGIEDQAIEGEQTLSINHIAKSEDSRYNALEKQIIFNIEDNDNRGKELNLYADNIIGLTDHDNQIQGSEIDDIIYGRDGNDELMGQGGNDLILGQKGADGLMGEAGNDVLIGGNRTDFIDGGIGDDILFGGDGNDRLYGKEGNDKLFGDFGNDRLDGGEGIDTLTGYIGNDAFVIGNNLETKLLNEVDIITDFKLTEDKIELPLGLTFEQLKITQGQNQWSQDTIIQLNSNGNYLAILQKVTAINLDRGDFI